MSANGLAVSPWKPLFISPDAGLSRKLSAVWRAIEEGEPIIECPRYIGSSALRELVSGHSPSVCFLDVGSDPEVALALMPELRELGISVVALHTGNEPDL